MERRSIVTLVIVAAVAVAGYLVQGLDQGPEGGDSGKAPRSDAPSHGCEHAHDEPREDVRAAERATLCLLNAEREAKGLRRLRQNGELRRAARLHAADMIEREFFAHVNPDGVDSHARILAAGYRPGPGGATAENLAHGEREGATPAEIVDGWMHSPGHRRNILHRRLEEIGIGIVPELLGGGRGAIYTTTFGGRGGT